MYDLQWDFQSKDVIFMKIEKVNENQIRCTLTKEDLADRQLKLSELAYGSEKARELFRDMIQQANYEFGFEVEDLPLMVEAIPLSSESIILVITKVEYPEELDTRFSKFSEAGEEYMETEELDNGEDALLQGADDILDLFRKIQKENERLQKEESADNADAPEGSEKNQKETQIERIEIRDVVKMFEFRSLVQVERLAHVLDGFYQGENDLIKDYRKERYYLLLHKSDHTPVEFNKVCNRISEYARQRTYSSAVGAFLSEHGEAILTGDAIQVLASL